MIEQDGRFTGAGGTSIYYRYWRPEREPRAVILVVHGAAEHSGRYDIFAERFTREGYAVAGYDHPGHGQSDGEPLMLNSFADYTSTLFAFEAQLSRDFPGTPLVLLGHSMGGLVCVNYLPDHQAGFVACVLSGPAVKSELKPGFVQMSLIRLLSRLLPKLGVLDRKSTRLNSSHSQQSRMPSSA